MYALTTMGWLLMLSRLLSGGFIGVILTLALAYFGHTNDVYVIERVGKEKKGYRCAGEGLPGCSPLTWNGFWILYWNWLECTHYTLPVCSRLPYHTIHLALSTGVTMIFSRFDISQFRSIAWFNTATALAFVVLQLVMFHGESGCRKPPQLDQRFYDMCRPH